MIGTILRYTPPDLEAAYRRWGCNCGPAALAACLQVPCATVRPWFAGFERRRYVNPTHMKEALGYARQVGYFRQYNMCRRLPHYGMAFLQIEGPWEDPGVPIRAAYRHTHWIATAYDQVVWVYDVNANGWLTQPGWEEQVMRRILAATPRATGWRVRSAFDLDLIPRHHVRAVGRAF